ncbi:MAG: hypothetical protein Q9195_008459 [Heterodermia aff. obscurata]
MHLSSSLRLLLLLANLFPFTYCLSLSKRTKAPSSLSSNSLDSRSPSAAAKLSPPIAAAWMYLSDDLNYSTIPPKWCNIDFATVDLLLIGPLGVQDDGTFGLYSSAKTGPLAHRFKWVLQKARAQKPGIKIFVSQFWGGSPHKWGDDLSALKNAQAIEKYATSVQKFMQTWKEVDGYDVDYEDTNVREDIGDILRQVRNKLDKVQDGRHFHVSVSPASTMYLKTAVPALSFVNMQTYSGGISLTLKDFLDLGLKSQQLLYGYNAEIPQQSHSIPAIEKAYTDGNLAGIHVWRLDSSDQQAEGERQKKIYNFLHPSGNEDTTA